MILLRARWLIFSLALSALALLAGCGSPISAENFARIETGMSEKEVFALLGEPSRIGSIDFAGVSGGVSTWRDGDTVITVQFLNGKVQGKQMSREAARAERRP